MGESISTGPLSFRWDQAQDKLIITAPDRQYELSGEEAQELLGFLYDWQQHIYTAAHLLPGWAQEPIRKQFLIQGGQAIQITEIEYEEGNE
jgi:hypothetical protein